jgi:2-polyprenyl-3-methyl-5-hydroxy-6-metoxy-1,4-benzoquinol methylase
MKQLKETRVEAKEQARSNEKAWWVGDINEKVNHQANAICPNCGSSGLDLFYGVSQIPVHSCLVMSSLEDAESFPKADLKLGLCRQCGFITNPIFDAEAQNYNPIYEDQQSYSPTFNAFSEQLAKSLIAKYDLHNKHVVEIGCGKGDFLISMCELGPNQGVGIDPTALPGRVQSEAAERVSFIQDFYSEKYSDKVGDMIMCRHTLEHIYPTRDFVNIVRRSIGSRKDTVVFFEVPDAARVLNDQAFWDVYYEHCSYFTLGSLARLFRSCGFEILDLACEYDDQYLLIEAKPVDTPSEKLHPLEEPVSEVIEMVQKFVRQCDNKLTWWRDYLLEAKKTGKRVVAWGSGSKCVSFFTTLGITDEVEHVIDINPHRHGKFIVGASKEVRSPEFLREYRPDIVVVMNEIYTREISEMLSGMELSPDLKAV